MFEGLTLPAIVAGVFLFLVFQVVLGSLVGKLLAGRS